MAIDLESIRRRVAELEEAEQLRASRSTRLRPILPGALVRPKFNMKVTLWNEYHTRVCPDGITRATMRRDTGFYLNEAALVIGVPMRPVRGERGTGVIMLYLPKSQRFCYTWDSYLKVVA